MPYSSSSSAPAANPGAIGLYNQQLKLMTDNYNQISSQYSQAQANTSAALGGIYGDYSALGGNINNLMESAYSVGAADIQGRSNQALARIKGSAINSGLGNSTIQMALQGQATGLANREYARLRNDVSQQAADRQTQIGLAGLNARQQGAGLQAGLAQSYMGNLANYRFAPQIDLYGQSNSSYSTSPDQIGGGGYGRGAGSTGGLGTSSGGSPFSSWLQNSGVPMYGSGGGGQGDRMGYAGLYGYGGGYNPGPYSGQYLEMGGGYMDDSGFDWGY